ncbi:MAG TPA: DUF1559 domain-containing protein [Pyrinomonadaceae bacterium]
MPIFMKIDGVRGDVTHRDHKNRSGASNGGVWRTTNFLTADPVGPASREPGLPGVTVFLDQNTSSGINPRPQIKTFICPSDPGVVQISRISLTPGGGIDGRDPAAKFKVGQVINQARSQGPNGKLYVATDVGVYQTSDGHGRLLVGTEGGIWRSGGARRAQCANNLKQMPLAMHNTTVDIIITDAGGMVLGGFRLQNASVSRHSGGVIVALGDGSVR